MRIKEGKLYRKAIAKFLNMEKPELILDIACGQGWIKKSIDYSGTVHGADLYADKPEDYAYFFRQDFNKKFPEGLGKYNCIVCCEAMSYLLNPGFFLDNVYDHLEDDGFFVLSLPNPTYVGARINQLLQGFPRSYSHFVKNTAPEPHMPWLMLGLFQLWFIMGLAGFKDIIVLDVPEKKPKRFLERPLGLLMKVYYRNRIKKSKTNGERKLWEQAMSDQVIYGRNLVISARKQQKEIGK